MSTVNQILDREHIEKNIVDLLQSFDAQCKNVQFKKGIYIYGASGSGKTYFVTEILKRYNYDIVKYDAGDTRNKALIESITSDNMSNNNVLNMMYKRKQKIAILMDEIEAMNSGDKWGITSLIKLIRQKKTKRQKLESQTYNPIICVSNYYVDKKIKELMKVCHVFELKTPTALQMYRIVSLHAAEEDRASIVDYSQGDLRKCFSIFDLIRKVGPGWADIMGTIQKKTFNEDSKQITRRIMENSIRLSDHGSTVNETDRTIVALLWHENVIDYLDVMPVRDRFSVYHRLLENICFADYIDRITFQNQIWQFNEMSSLIKTMYNNKIFHRVIEPRRIEMKEVRFTKILTKYSTEYNNSNFVSSLCNKMEMDRKDVMSFFQEMRILGGKDAKSAAMLEMLETAEISRLDTRRFYRYLDQSEKKEDAKQVSELEEEDEIDEPAVEWAEV